MTETLFWSLYYGGIFHFSPYIFKRFILVPAFSTRFILVLINDAIADVSFKCNK